MATDPTQQREDRALIAALAWERSYWNWLDCFPADPMADTYREAYESATKELLAATAALRPYIASFRCEISSSSSMAW